MPFRVEGLHVTHGMLKCQIAKNSLESPVEAKFLRFLGPDWEDWEFFRTLWKHNIEASINRTNYNTLINLVNKRINLNGSYINIIMTSVTLVKDFTVTKKQIASPGVWFCTQTPVFAARDLYYADYKPGPDPRIPIWYCQYTTLLFFLNQLRYF